jgi:hypothetical protein
VSPMKYELGFYISEDGILLGHRREIHKSYKEDVPLKRNKQIETFRSETTPTDKDSHTQNKICCRFLNDTTIVPTDGKLRHLLTVSFRAWVAINRPTDLAFGGCGPGGGGL